MTHRPESASPNDHYFAQARFQTSAPSLSSCPEDTGSEIAFIGRSNAGKSSALNRLCRQKKLAMCSKTPGRTQMLNFFLLPNGERLVDLPGYGYANTTKSNQRAWAALINEYLQQRQSLKGLVLLMDCRHPLKPADWQLLEWCQACELPLHVLLTKADKLSKNQSQQALASCRKALKQAGISSIGLQLFSSTQPLGLEACWQFLNQRLIAL